MRFVWKRIVCTFKRNRQKKKTLHHQNKFRLWIFLLNSFQKVGQFNVFHSQFNHIFFPLCATDKEDISIWPAYTRYGNYTKSSHFFLPSKPYNRIAFSCCLLRCVRHFPYCIGLCLLQIGVYNFFFNQIHDSL